MSNNLPEELLRMRDYVKDEVLKNYESIGPAGTFAIEYVIKPAIKAADEAITSGDVTAMISSLRELQDIQ